MRKQRTPREQAQVVEGWRRSGLSAKEFAPQAGVSVASLHRWSHEAVPMKRRERQDQAALRLVEAVPLTARIEAESWSVEGPLGTLRVRGVMTEATLRLVVTALIGSR